MTNAPNPSLIDLMKSPTTFRCFTPLDLLLLLAIQCASLYSAPLVTPYAQQGKLEIREVALPKNSLGRYESLEIKIDCSAHFDNPFDPSDVSLEGRFQSASGTRHTVPGFFYRSYERSQGNGREVLKPGPFSWRIRFTPTEVGTYSAILLLRDRSGQTESQSFSFEVRPSDLPGFVRISRTDPRYLAFDNGQSYFPIGANTCWAYGRGTYDYDEWFARYAEAGANYGRLWLSPNWTSFALEVSGKPEEGRGLGQFDLGNAWRIDYVLDLAAAKGMRLMLCIDSYNILRKKDGYPQWDNTPHNAQNGGPLQNPTEFWTNSVIEKVYLDKLRYLVARYAHHTAVYAWEFWNEADITTGYRSGPSKEWHAKMASALRELDPWDHPITTSFASTRGDPEVDQLPGIEVVQSHHYNSPDLVLTLARAQEQKAAYGKPHIVGEIGADSGGPRAKDDPDGLQVHDPIWISIVTGGAGTAQPWWWDNNIHPNNLYPLFAAASRFTTGIDWPKENFRPGPLSFSSADPQTQTNQSRLLGWALTGNKTAVAWVRLEDRTWRRICQNKETIPAALPTSATLSQISPGRWSCQFWDTWKGQIIRTENIQVPASGEVQIQLPSIEKDLALKLIKQE